MQVFVGEYTASIYPEGNGWTGAICLGSGPDGRRRRLKRKAATQKALMRKLVTAVSDLENGVRSARDYTVERAVKDLLTVLDRKGLAASTLETYRGLVDLHLIPQLGKARVRDLTADDVEAWLFGRADRLTTVSVSILHGLLKRALRRAQRHDKVVRNVAEFVDTPRGSRPRRLSRSMSVQEAAALLEEARSGRHRLGPYVALGLLTGLRPEELRALTWDQVNLEARELVVTRAARSGGDTKTPGSRRGLRLPPLAVEALASARAFQAADKLAAGPDYQDHGLVFARPDGEQWTSDQVLRRFRVIVEAASLDRSWCVRELRHTFVSVLSDSGVATQVISDLVGHRDTSVTELVYRHQLRPVIEGGAEPMQDLFAGLLSSSA
ncbi:tyrosine-type recombinase/integrase [Actinomadura coerulea]|uniref:tyrosine-type recombinase/integrase n=1 Tax=Actinomadura coerulea TaxID=46159 RepID=UPI0034214643